MAKQDGSGKKRKPPVDLSQLGKAKQKAKASRAAARSQAPTETRQSGTGEIAGLPLDIDWKLLAIFAAIAASLAIAAHINSISNTIVFQDRATLTPIASVLKEDALWRGIGTDLLTKPLTQPWVRVSYALDWVNYKTTVSWFHAANVAVHTLTTLYVYLFCWRLGRRWKLQDQYSLSPEFMALCAAGLFAVHPFTSETVAYLSSRSPLIATNNIMLALNTFLMAVLAKRFKTKMYAWILTIAAGYMAVTSGLEALALPLLMILTLWTIKPEEQSFVDWIYDRLPALGFSLLLLLGLPFLLLLGATFPQGTSYAQETLNQIGYLKAQGTALITYYLPKFFVPWGLSIDPQYQFKDVINYATIPGLAVFGFAIAMAVKFRQLPFVLFSCLFTIFALLPHVILVQPQAVADSAFYLPLISLCTLCGGLVSIAFKANPRPTVAAASVVALAFLALTSYRNSEWTNDLVLWESTVRASQKSPRAHALLAVELIKQQKEDRALEEANRATELGDKYALGWVAKGNLALQRKDYPEAEKAFEKAVAACNEKLQASEITTAAGLGLAEAYLKQDKPDQALTILYTIGAKAKGDPRASALAALASYQTGNPRKAYVFLQQAAELNPMNEELWSKLADVSLRLHKKEALRAAAIANQLEPSAINKLLLARALFANDRVVDAKTMLRELAEQSPQDARVLAMLSRAHEQDGETQEAEKFKKQAIAIDPTIFSKDLFAEIHGRKPGATSPVAPGGEKPAAAPTGEKPAATPAGPAPATH